jgi:hypothetical protein
MEKPSEVSSHKAAETLSKKLEGPKYEKKREAAVEAAEIQHKKRKAKGPNPLSCKKKQKIVAHPPATQNRKQDKNKTDKK